MGKNQKKCSTMKDVLLKHKSILVFLLIMVVCSKISSATASMPDKKESTALENQSELNSQKYDIQSTNRELKNKLKTQKNKNTSLNTRISSEESSGFNVKSGTKWKGTYNLEHSVDTFKLTLEINEHNAIFNFECDGEKGSFYMGKHMIQPTTGYIELHATEWKDGLSGYDMVDLSGVSKGNKINGIVTETGNNRMLGTFSLTKMN